MANSNTGLPAPPIPMQFRTDTIVWRQGDTASTRPLFILILNNIALERPLYSGNFAPDLAGWSRSDLAVFTDTARYIVRNLFGELPGQAEKLLADSPYARRIRVSSVFVSGLAPGDATALVGEEDFSGTGIIVPRRGALAPMLRALRLDPDIVFVVSNSPTHSRASAYGTTDDDTRGGVPFIYDGRRLYHRYFHLIPGFATIHTTSRALTAAHEFGHAFSSYTNGFVTDLYVDGDQAFNRKVGRPIPDLFASYRGASYRSDKERDGLGYPSDWLSYHPELADPTQPALMDNFFYSTGEVGSRHDRLTKRYTLDRVEAKVARSEGG